MELMMIDYLTIWKLIKSAVERPEKPKILLEMMGLLEKTATPFIEYFKYSVK